MNNQFAVLSAVDLTDDEINLLVVGLVTFHQELKKEKRSRYFSKEKARDKKLLPDLIAKLNNAKSVTVTGGFSFRLGDQDVDWRFLVPEE
jgi:hypothetical protein